MKSPHITPLYKLTYLLLFLVLFSRCQNDNNWSNKSILVTAPMIYNDRLSSQINATGMKAIPFPVIETALINENPDIDSILLNLDSYDWISLTSRNAIKAFIKRAGELDIPLSQLKRQHYCAIGKDKDLLRSFGLDSILVNNESSPQGIVHSIKQLDCTDKSIAVFIPQVVGMPESDVFPNYIDSLEIAGLRVTKVRAYTTKVCKPSNENTIIHRIKKGNIDLIAFTSTGEIEALLSVVGGPEKLQKTPIACFGPYAYKNAIELGLQPAFMAKDFSSFDGYVNAIVDNFAQSPRNR